MLISTRKSTCLLLAGREKAAGRSPNRMFIVIKVGRVHPNERVMYRYGMKNAHIPQDVIAWKPSIWDRTELTKEEEAFVRVCSPGFPHFCD